MRGVGAFQYGVGGCEGGSRAALNGPESVPGVVERPLEALGLSSTPGDGARPGSAVCGSVSGHPFPGFDAGRARGAWRGGSMEGAVESGSGTPPGPRRVRVERVEGLTAAVCMRVARVAAARRQNPLLLLDY